MKLMQAEAMARHFGSFLILFIVSAPLSKGIGVDLSCPEIFNDGDNNITCTINKTAIENASCFTVQNSVTFDVTIDSTQATDCFVQYNAPEICTGKTNNANCWCDKSEGDIYVYKLSFVANSSKHQHAQLECKLCVSPQYNLSVTTKGSCHKFKFHNDGRPGLVMSSPLTVTAELSTEITSNGGVHMITRLTPTVFSATFLLLLLLSFILENIRINLN